jgi:magnesium transporter
MNILKNKNVKWVHIVQPTEKDITWVKEKFSVHPMIVNEIRKPSAVGRVEIFKNHLFFVCYFPFYDKDEEASLRMEIDFIVTKDTVVTIQYEPLKEVFYDFHFGNDATPLELVHHLMGHIITFEERQLRHIREKVETAGKELFKNKEDNVFRKLTYLKRDVSEYRIIVRLQEPALKSLLSKGAKFWGDDAGIYLDDLLGNHLNVVSQLEDCREAIADFEDTNNQLMGTKVNQTMKTLTALSFLTLPFMFIATIFSMNAKDTPFVDSPGAFWIIVGAMAIGIIALTIYFKKKKWF